MKSSADRSMAGPASPAFECRSVTYSYSRGHCAICDVTLALKHGSVCALIGPNGSGKSTLLKLLLGALRPTSGAALFDGKPCHEWDRTEMARRIGVVTQSEDTVFPITVRELVAMGRYPHLGVYRRETKTDRDAVDRALAWCSVAEFADRPMNTLSGGERQRARIARALAQEPAVLVLDEPTAALDVAHEMSIFELLAHHARATGLTVVIATHNINLASRYADRVLLLDRGRIAAFGAPRDVITRTLVESVYHWPVSVQPLTGSDGDAGAPQIIPLRKEEP